VRHLSISAKKSILKIEQSICIKQKQATTDWKREREREREGEKEREIEREIERGDVQKMIAASGNKHYHAAQA
jgi:hypothetical protein